MTAPAQPTTQQPARQLSAAQMAALIALLEAQSRARFELTATAIAAAIAAFEALAPGDWWDSRKTSAAVRSALRVVQATQTQAARLTDAYLARAASIMSGRNVRPVGAVDVTKLRRAIPDQVARQLIAGQLEPAWVMLGEHDPANRRVIPAETINETAPLVVPDPAMSAAERVARQRAGQAAAEAVDPGQPYGRVADGYRFQVSVKQVPEVKARSNAVVRVAAVAHTDVTLAVREQVRRSLNPSQIPGITGYRRILRPELSETGPCGLCVVAADRVYHIGDLKEIHDECRCEVLPIIGAMDPGLDLNRSDLDAIYAAAGGTGGDLIKDGKRHSLALKNIRVAMAEHGELGPVLVDADLRHRGPREVVSARIPDKATQMRVALKGWEESYARLIRRRELGEDVERPLQWHTRRIDDLEHQLAALGGR